MGLALSADTRDHRGSVHSICLTLCVRSTHNVLRAVSKMKGDLAWTTSRTLDEMFR